MLTVRPAAERGHAQHGWLDSWHSFSFADYYDPQHIHFGPLRVINEDRVQASQGFGTHSHADMEILSYVLEGQLEHKDSMGTGSIIRPGDVQRMSAGRGVQHSEFNPSPTSAVHFLQIWIIPDTRGIAPEYEQRTIAEAEKRGRLRLIASPTGEDASLGIHQDARVFSGLFTKLEQARHPLAAGRLGYLQLAKGVATVNGVRLSAGDGALLREEPAIHISEGQDAEVLVFDLPAA
jgi:redox-sensitive bicupin YhaK (pirin superfamily)